MVRRAQLALASAAWNGLGPSLRPRRFARFSTGRSAMTRRPLLRAEEASKQCRDVEIGVYLCKVEAKAGWRNLDMSKVRRRRQLETLSVGRFEGNGQPGAQLYNDLPLMLIKYRRRRS